MIQVTREITMNIAKFQLGDIISFTLNTGEQIKAKAVKETKDGMIFVTIDCLKTEDQMYKSPCTNINYLNSLLRKTLNGEILESFPADIRRRMAGMQISNTDFFDMLRIPTEHEIFGKNYYGKDENASVDRFYGMENRHNRMAFKGSETGDWECYWLQNRAEEETYNHLFGCADEDGDANFDNAFFCHGVRLVFLLAQNNNEVL